LTVTKQEIVSQPGAWGETLRHLKQKNRFDYPALQDYEQIIFIGCGSTYYLSLWAARLCQEATGIACLALPSSELVLYQSSWLQANRKNLLLAISRSGETTETIEATKMFRNNSLGDTVVVTCYPDSELASVTPSVIDTPHGWEKSIVQTRSFSCMMLAVSWLLDHDVPDLHLDVIQSAGRKVLQQASSLISRLDNESIDKIYFLGSGPWFGLSCECMLKNLEMSLTFSQSYHFMEFRHGPMSLVDDRSLVVGLLSKGDAADYELKVMKEMKDLKAQTIIVSEQEIAADGVFQDRVAFDSGLPPSRYAILYLLLAQLLACERALIKKLDPDLPNNLKAVVKLDRK